MRRGVYCTGSAATCRVLCRDALRTSCRRERVCVVRRSSAPESCALHCSREGLTQLSTVLFAHEQKGSDSFVSSLGEPRPPSLELTLTTALARAKPNLVSALLGQASTPQADALLPGLDGRGGPDGVGWRAGKLRRWSPESLARRRGRCRPVRGSEQAPPFDAGPSSRNILRAELWPVSLSSAYQTCESPSQPHFSLQGAIFFSKTFVCQLCSKRPTARTATGVATAPDGRLVAGRPAATSHTLSDPHRRK